MTQRMRAIIRFVGCAFAVAVGACNAGPQASDSLLARWQPTADRNKAIDAPLVKEPDLLPKTHLAAGRLHESQNQPARAVDQYQAALRLNPDLLEAYGRLGVCLTQLGRYEEAEKAFVEGIERAPDKAHLRNNLAFCYISQRRWADAEAELRNALELKPDFVRARINLGLVLAQQSKFDAALEAFRYVLKEDDAQFNMGLMYQSLGHYAQADKAFREALARNPQLVAAQKRIEQLQPFLRRAAEATPAPAPVETAAAPPMPVPPAADDVATIDKKALPQRIAVEASKTGEAEDGTRTPDDAIAMTEDVAADGEECLSDIRDEIAERAALEEENARQKALEEEAAKKAMAEEAARQAALARETARREARERAAADLNALRKSIASVPTLAVRALTPMADAFGKARTTGVALAAAMRASKHDPRHPTTLAIVIDVDSESVAPSDLILNDSDWLAALDPMRSLAPAGWPEPTIGMTSASPEAAFAVTVPGTFASEPEVSPIAAVSATDLPPMIGSWGFDFDVDVSIDGLLTDSIAVEASPLPTESPAVEATGTIEGDCVGAWEGPHLAFPRG